MKNLILEILAWSYSVSGVICALAYWPTIKDLMHHKKKSANIHSYILWTISMGIAFVYSLFVLPDLPFILVSAVNFLACAVILFLSIKIKNH